MTAYLAPGMIDMIDFIISKQFGCTVFDLHDLTRRKPQSTARQLAMYYRRTELKHRPTAIARYYGLNQATVNYAVRIVPFWMKTDKQFRANTEACIIALKKVMEKSTTD
jgi:chromosomal replication initiation ATPase DnaA